MSDYPAIESTPLFHNNRSTAALLSVVGCIAVVLWSGCGDRTTAVKVPTPQVEYMDVRADGDEFPPCLGAAPCSIPAFTSFTIRFKGKTSSGAIDGITWQVAPDRWEPFGSPEPRFISIASDTVVTDANGRIWSLRDGVVSLRIRPEDAFFESRTFSMQARVRAGGILSPLDASSQFSLANNYPPTTRIDMINACDCPNPAPNCDSLAPQPIGWIVGKGFVSFPEEEWRPYCEGDTLPLAAHVRFYASAADDARDAAKDSTIGIVEPGVRFRYEISRGAFSYRTMRYTSLATPQENHTLPNARVIRAAAVQWGTCSFDYVFEAAAADENALLDPSPARVSFTVGSPPRITRFDVPSVVVLVPTCGASILCPEVGPFGADTLVVIGTRVEDGEIPTPLHLGLNRFKILFPVWGSDHPRDSNPPGQRFYTEETEGRIRSWKYSFDCLDPGCNDFQPLFEDLWREDFCSRCGSIEEVQVLDEPITLTVPLDTLCLTDPCRIDSIQVVLKFDQFGRYEYTAQGRDTRPFASECSVPVNLDPRARGLRINTALFGYTTQLMRKELKWVQLADVRPRRSPAPQKNSLQR